MQICVTRKKSKNRRKSIIKSVIKVILIFLFVIISSAIFIRQKRKTLMYLEREFYFVSVASSKKSSNLETKAELLKNLGGASVIYNKDGVYYLIANVYLDLSSAEEIKTNLLNYFNESEILTIKTKSVSKKNRKILRENKDAVKYLYDLSFVFQNLQMGYLSGTVSDGKLISSMVKYRLELEKLKDNIIINCETCENLRAFYDLFSGQIANFLNELTISSSRQNYVCNYFVGFYINYIEMYDCL